MPAKRAAAGSRHVAFLRAINVGGNTLIAMAALRKAFEDAGFANVRTYIQSGNVLFDARGPEDSLTRRLETLLKDEFGFDVRVMVRTVDEVATIVRRGPFRGVEADAGTTLYVSFLSAKPSKQSAAKLLALTDDRLTLSLAGREFYAVLRRKEGDHKPLSNVSFENILGVAATTRSWKTVLAIAALAGRVS